MAKEIKFESVCMEYQDLLDTTKIDPKWETVLVRYVKIINDNKEKYQRVSDKTGVPWEMIGAIHAMEGGCNFSTHLHNGDPLTAKTKQVPKNRPATGKAPFSWEESAIDALTLKGLDKINEWTDIRVVYELERYNGWGYRLYHKDTLTPYLWSGTNHYTKGKYVSDGKWDAQHVSKQVGAVPLYLRLKKVPLSKQEVIQNSAHLTMGARAKATIAAVGTGIGGLFSLDTLGLVTSELQKLREIISEHALIFLGVGGIAFYLLLQWMESKNVKAHQEGRYIPSGVKDDT